MYLCSSQLILVSERTSCPELEYGNVKNQSTKGRIFTLFELLTLQLRED